jgi:hypothetical protein
MTAVVIIMGIALLLLGFLVLGLLRSHADILKKLHDLGVGETPPTTPPLRTRPGVPTPRTGITPAHDIIGSTPSGGTVKVGLEKSSGMTLLAFLSTGCLTCRDFWDAFAAEDFALPGHATRLVIVTKSLEHESTSQLRKLAPPHHTTVASTPAWDAYEVPVSPYFILIDGPSGMTLGEGAAATWPQVENLLGQAMADMGVAPTSDPAARARNARSGPAREAKVDDELAAAGIAPGHPSLYPEATPDEEEQQ